MALHLGVSQMGAGSKTSVGGYDEHNKDKEGTTLIKEELNKLPSEKVREILKANHFRWHSVKKVWYGYKTQEEIEKALI